MGPRRYSALALCEAAARAARAGPKKKREKRREEKKDEQEKKAKRVDRTRRAKDGERWIECEIGEKEEDRGWKRRRTNEGTNVARPRYGSYD